MLRVTLEQWRAFVATAQFGSFQKAADQLNKTQSAIGHSIRKMEGCLGQRLFDLNGRQARITQVGKMLLPHARELIAEAEQTERLCRLKCIECLEGAGEMPIAVDVAFPIDVLLAAMTDLSTLYPSLSIRIHETSRTDAATLMADGYVRIAIARDFPRTVRTEPILSVPFVCVAAPAHPLGRQGRGTASDLDRHRQIALEDAPRHGSECAGGKRWTITHAATSLSLVRAAQGYAWLPLHVVRDDLGTGALVQLTVEGERDRAVALRIGYREDDEDCDAVLAFVSILRDLVAEGDDRPVPEPLPLAGGAGQCCSGAKAALAARPDLAPVDSAQTMGHRGGQ